MVIHCRGGLICGGKEKFNFKSNLKKLNIRKSIALLLVVFFRLAHFVNLSAQ